MDHIEEEDVKNTASRGTEGFRRGVSEALQAGQGTQEWSGLQKVSKGIQRPSSQSRASNSGLLAAIGPDDRH